MTEERPSQFAESALSQNIWQRYVASPGVIQMKPVLHSLQHSYQWSLRRASLSADIQRRWLPDDSTQDQVNWSALPFLHAPAASPELRNRPAGSVPAAPSDHTITPVDQMQVPAAEPLKIVHIDRKPAGISTNLASQPPIAQPSRSLMPVEQMQISDEPLKIVHIDRKLAGISTGLASQPSVENSSTAFPVSSGNVTAIDPEPGMYPAVSLPGRTVEIGQQHSGGMVSRVIDSEPMTVVSPRAVTQPLSQSGATLLQRHSLASTDQGSQPSDIPSAILGMHENPVTGRGVDLPAHPFSTPQDTRAETGITYPVQATGHIIQRTSLATFESPTEPAPLPLPLVRPLPVQSEGSTLPGFIQAAPAPDRQQQPPLVNLIQRQSQTTAVPASSSPDSPAASAGVTSPAVVSSPAAGVDIDRISEEILRIIMNRMAVERERRGIGSWH